MPIPVSKLLPDPTDLTSLEPEELAGVLLEHLNTYRSGESSIFQNGRINLQQLLAQPQIWRPAYKARQSGQLDEIDRAVIEAWTWLQTEGFLLRDPTQPAEWYNLSRRAERLKSRTDFEAYRKASLLPKAQLHPLLASKVYPAFLRGDYDTAIFQSFKEVEIAVRTAGGFGSNDLGTDLMRKALRPIPKNNQPSAPPGPLTDTSIPVAEQEATMSLFAGAIGFYKNPQSHRHVPTEAASAAEVIMLASQLLRIVDTLKAQQSAPVQP